MARCRTSDFIRKYRVENFSLFFLVFDTHCDEADSYENQRSQAQRCTSCSLLYQRLKTPFAVSTIVCLFTYFIVGIEFARTQWYRRGFAGHSGALFSRPDHRRSYVAVHTLIQHVIYYFFSKTIHTTNEGRGKAFSRSRDCNSCCILLSCRSSFTRLNANQKFKLHRSHDIPRDCSRRLCR